MRNFTRSALRFSWAMSLLATRGLARMVGMRPPGTAAELDALSEAAGDRLDGVFERTYGVADDLQNRVVDGVFGSLPGQGPKPRPGGAFDASRLVVIGDGLSAGMGHFALEGSFQSTSFPAFLAAALGTPLRQPLLQPPGLGDVIGLEPQPAVVPEIRQTTVLHELPSRAELDNLSVPGFLLRDALERRPTVPLVHRDSSKATLTNFILGLPDLADGCGRGRTQIELARDREPTLALVCFGYDEALSAAVSADYTTLPSGAAFGHRLERLLGELPAEATKIVTTVPNPLHTSYFSSPGEAALILKTTPAFLAQQWGVRPGDLIHLRGLWQMGCQTMARRVRPLAGAVIDASFAAAVASSIAEVNEAIRSSAGRAGAHVFELESVVAEVARHGLATGGKNLASHYLGGLYLLNGSYPGPTLNAHIANCMMLWLRDSFAATCEPLPLGPIAAGDVNTQTELAAGPPVTDAFLRPRTPDEIPAPLDPDGPVVPVPIQTTYPSMQPGKAGCVPAVGVPAAGLSDPSFSDPEFRPLDVPAAGLDYTLDINPELSCFGDALRVVDCPGEAPIIPGQPPFGICERTFFGGFLPTTSQLSGKIHVKILPPDGEGKARFEIRHPGGLRGNDGDLTGPQLFRMPVQDTQVRDLPGLTSSGILDTRTGCVLDFHYNLQNMNTALYSLLKLNPGLPKPILSTLLTFPGQPGGGSTWAEFTPRPDGLFDVSLEAKMFVPFGNGTAEQPLRFAVPFTMPDLSAASFISRGTSIHPRIFVTTRAPRPSHRPRLGGPEFPFDSVVEMTASSRETYFGDAFDLHAPEFGQGGATGRSQLLSRIRIQFGSPVGDTVPVVFQFLPPGGLLNDQPAAPPFLPPGVSRGGSGFDTTLHFAKQTYPQSGLASPDDPFNVCTTSIDLRTGETVGPLLWRAYVVQALFAELVKVEPCTPADSFNYQGPARFDLGPQGELALHWNGTVFLPYPKGFNFPSSGPGGLPPIVIQGDSRLDPFRAARATSSLQSLPPGVSHGEVAHARSPGTGAEFSYRWSIPFDREHADRAAFEYLNHTDGGTFTLTCLTWLDFAYALGGDTQGSNPGAPNPGPSLEPQILTFSGLGTWSPDPGNLHQVSVQISTAPGVPFVGIQVDGGVTSNVDIKPEHTPRA